MRFCNKLYYNYLKTKLEETFESFDQNDSIINGNRIIENKSYDRIIKPEFELSKNGLKLSPRGRYQVIS